MVPSVGAYARAVTVDATVPHVPGLRSDPGRCRVARPLSSNRCRIPWLRRRRAPRLARRASGRARVRPGRRPQRVSAELSAWVVGALAAIGAWAAGRSPRVLVAGVLLGAVDHERDRLQELAAGWRRTARGPPRPGRAVARGRGVPAAVAPDGRRSGAQGVRLLSPPRVARRPDRGRGALQGQGRVPTGAPAALGSRAPAGGDQVPLRTPEAAIRTSPSSGSSRAPQGTWRPVTRPP